MLPDDPRHGTYAGYSAHWDEHEKPCEPCTRAAGRVRKRNHYLASIGQPATLPAVGTARRIRALQALGWTVPQIADEAGVNVKSLWNPLYRNSTVYRATFEAVAEAYERMCMTTPPRETTQQKRDVSYLTGLARKRGWPKPLAWDDIDDPDERPAATWEPRQYRASELASEWAHLRRAGVSIDAAATQLGITVDAIEKAIERTRKAAA